MTLPPVAGHIFPTGRARRSDAKPIYIEFGGIHISASATVSDASSDQNSCFNQPRSMQSGSPARPAPRKLEPPFYTLSPCYKRDSVAFHFTWKKNWPTVSKVLPMIEKALEPFDARPHWGKLFAISPDRLRALYEKLPEFRGLMKSNDPAGKFRNEFLQKCTLGE
jgi:hypothetical protein